jgi:anhydro-N-acetylmuramic acid kinase
MTGTSLAGIDAALVEVTGLGLAIEARLLAVVSRELGGLSDVLRPMTEGQPLSPVEYRLAARQLGDLHACVVETLCQKHLPAGERLDMVVAHGQTIWHAPDMGVSWQLFDPQPVVRRQGTAVCFNLRQADLMAGGEGAPITPMSDWVMYRHPSRDRLIVNLGGIVNVTHLPAGGSPAQVTGSDVGPCNLLIDGVVRKLFPGKPFDIDGEIAGQGRVNSEVYDLIQSDTTRSRKSNRSLGREDFTHGWVSGLVERLLERLSPNDIVAGAVQAAAKMIGQVPCPNDGEMVLAGGGALNPVLVQRIREAVGGRRVILSDEIGVPVQARESMGMAILGALCQDGVPITLPQVTGATDPGVGGHWAFPGVCEQ